MSTPKHEPMKKMLLAIPPSMLEKLDALCERKHARRTEMVRRLISEELEREDEKIRKSAQVVFVPQNKEDRI